MAQAERVSSQTKIAKGQRDRAALIRRFGFVPYSVLRIPKGELHAQLHHMARERGDLNRRRDPAATGQLGVNMYDRLSVMAAGWVDFFVRYYTVPGQTYLDPFSAQGVQAQVAALRGLNYYGSDLCEPFVTYTQRVLERIEAHPALHIEVRHADSTDPAWIPDGIGDFCFTSPPYWDIEHYSDDPRQIGDLPYSEFLDGMEQIARAWHPKFKPGAHIVVNVADIRREQQLIAYHADTIALFQRAGYTLTDLAIIEEQTARLTKVFAVMHNMHRRLPKVHEYALVFAP